MSQTPGGTIIRKAKTGPNIYSVLAIVATLALAIAFGFVAYHNTQMTGQSNPFVVVQPSEMPTSK